MSEKIAEMPQNEQDILHELDTRRLDWLITALEDGDDVLAAAIATIDAEMNRERVLGVSER